MKVNLFLFLCSLLLSSCSTTGNYTPNLEGPCLYGFYDWEKEPSRPPAKVVRWIVVPQDRIEEFCGKPKYVQQYIAGCAHIEHGIIFSIYTQEVALRRNSGMCGESHAEHELKHLAGYRHK